MLFKVSFHSIFSKIIRVSFHSIFSKIIRVSFHSRFKESCKVINTHIICMGGGGGGGYPFQRADVTKLQSKLSKWESTE